MNKWDARFISLAKLVASWSKDPSTQTGAVIVRPDRTVASIGYNGFPRGCDDALELYLDRDTKLSRVVHCELNAILSAREPLKGYTLYQWPFMACDRCAAHMIQAGITRTVSPIAPPDKAVRWGKMFKDARTMFREASVVCEEVYIG